MIGLISLSESDCQGNTASVTFFMVVFIFVIIGLVEFRVCSTL